MGHRGRAEVRRPVDGSDGAAAVAAAVLGAVLAASFFLFDPRAEAGFDAPKRLVAMAGVAVAAAALLLGGRPLLDVRWSALTRAARGAVLAAGAALALVVLSAFASPRPSVAVDALRAMGVPALLLPLGASRVLAGARGRALLAIYVAAAAASAAVAVGQAAGSWGGVEVESLGGRTDAFALVGNEGVLAVALALAAVGATAPWLAAAGRRFRLAAAAAVVLLAAGIASTANITGALALLAGGAVVVVTSFPRRALALAGAAVGVAVVLASLPPVRGRIGELTHNLSRGQTNALTSGRLAAWAAAVEMVRERPLLGYGAGTFAAEFAPHRVAAEIRLQRRLVHPKVTSHFGEAHCEPLQAAAEWGVPAAAAALAALALLMLCGARAVVRGAPLRAELVVVLALLTAGSVAALLWFPLQRPITAVPLLLAAGRCWRLSGASP